MMEITDSEIWRRPTKNKGKKT